MAPVLLGDGFVQGACHTGNPLLTVSKRQSVRPTEPAIGACLPRGGEARQKSKQARNSKPGLPLRSPMTTQGRPGTTPGQTHIAARFSAQTLRPHRLLEDGACLTRRISTAD